ncbi:hypothetical protein LZ31DRAFT_541227 [Colletotrichum somersetense]|nr:hypothetical protein LZ31DRAFT_541227 [Colletotrichum somersetense]
MWIHGLHPLTHTLVTFVLLLFSLTKMATSTPTAMSRVVDDSMEPENQERAERPRLSERDELLVDAFSSLTPAIQVPDIRAPQKRDERNCLGIYLCTKEDWKGDCYWACFRKGLEVQLEAEWAPNIKSVRPDHGAKCKFFLYVMEHPVASVQEATLTRKEWAHLVWDVSTVYDVVGTLRFNYYWNMRFISVSYV